MLLTDLKKAEVQGSAHAHCSWSNSDMRFTTVQPSILLVSSLMIFFCQKADDLTKYPFYVVLNTLNQYPFKFESCIYLLIIVEI